MDLPTAGDLNSRNDARKEVESEKKYTIEILALCLKSISSNEGCSEDINCQSEHK